jgi:hypothetical protein
LLGFQLGACGHDIRTVLPGGVESFFEGDVVTIVKSPDRAYCGLHLLLGAQPRTNLVQRQIRLLGNEFEQPPLLVLLERRAAVTRPWLSLDTTGRRPTLNPANRRRRADFEHTGCLPRAFRHPQQSKPLVP